MAPGGRFRAHALVADPEDSISGLAAGLNVLPKCTACSTYSYSVDAIHIQRLQAAFVKRAAKLGLYEGRVINLDFHTVPHDGDDSVLERHWAGARGKVMKGVPRHLPLPAGGELSLRFL